jgi:AP-1 complex subunit beta-1
VIAAMTVGKDVSMLFSDVVKCIHTTDLELKKLVYLYVMNYSKTQPELAILAVNTFVQDAENPNPLIRALAIRSMGCIRVERITEYLCEPLRAAMKDRDPYVRKTAAICVAKLADINFKLAEDQGFIDGLNDLLTDGNPMVVANAVAALAEISEYTERDVFRISSRSLGKLLPALNDCSEWGQVYILNALADYSPRDSQEAEQACERVTPRLNHANAAVVLAAVKLIFNYMEFITNSEVSRDLMKKLTPPLVTLMSRRPEIQYVALRNINLIVQSQPSVLAADIRVFFCKYNDPIFVKLEKLDVLLQLVTEETLEQVLLELKEYAQEVDVEFVRRSVRAIGRCAIKLESMAQRCVK